MKNRQEGQQKGPDEIIPQRAAGKPIEVYEKGIEDL